MLVLGQKAQPLELGEGEYHSISETFAIPSVIRLLYLVKRPLFTRRLSRREVFWRDKFTCQYCGKAFPLPELTFDHLVPVAQGGRKDWENIVTCCITCNRKKGGRTPGEVGLRVIRMPRRPTRAPTIRIMVGLRNTPQSWRDYLYWNVELDDS